MTTNRKSNRIVATVMAILMAVCCFVPGISAFAKSTGHGQTGDLSDIFDGSYNSAASEYFGNIATTNTENPTTDVNKFNNPTAYRGVMKDVQAFLAGAPKYGSDYDKEKYVFSKISTTCNYKTNNFGSSGDAGAVQAILYNHGGDINNIARGFKYFCNMLGLKCWVVYGKLGAGDFAWDIVQLNGKRYVTNIGGSISGDMSSDAKPLVTPIYSHMNMPKRQAERWGFAENDYSKQYITDWSDCIYDDQDYFKKNKLYFTSYDSFKAALPGLIAKRNNEGGPVVRVEFPKNDQGDALAKYADQQLFAHGDIDEVVAKANTMTSYPVHVYTSYGHDLNFLSFPISSSHVPVV